jgi:hypothetical protein
MRIPVIHPNSFLAGLITGASLAFVGVMSRSDFLGGVAWGLAMVLIIERVAVHEILPRYLPKLRWSWLSRLRWHGK